MENVGCTTTVKENVGQEGVRNCKSRKTHGPGNEGKILYDYGKYSFAGLEKERKLPYLKMQF